MFAAAFPPGPAWGSDILVHWYSADGLSDWAPVQEIVISRQTGGLWYDPVSPMPFFNNATNGSCSSGRQRDMGTVDTFDICERCVID